MTVEEGVWSSEHWARWAAERRARRRAPHPPAAPGAQALPPAAARARVDPAVIAVSAARQGLLERPVSPVLLAIPLVGIPVALGLISLRNRHFSRTRLLARALLDLHAGRAIPRDRAAELAERLEIAWRGLGDMSPMLLALAIIFFPIGLIYLLHRLTRDLEEHRRAEAEVLPQLLEPLGIEPPKHWREPPEQRSTLRDALLSLLTLTIYFPVWLYRVGRDYKTHIEEHRRLDEQIIRRLSAAVSREASEAPQGTP